MSLVISAGTGASIVIGSECPSLTSGASGIHSRQSKPEISRKGIRLCRLDTHLHRATLADKEAQAPAGTIYGNLSKMEKKGLVRFVV